LIQKTQLEITNVVSTSNLNQKIAVEKFVYYPWGIYNSQIYGGRCGYVKTQDMHGRVTVFPSGKMISVGAPSVKKSVEQLNQAKFCLVCENLATDVKLDIKVQNVVATLTLKNKLRIREIVSTLSGAIYEPEQFPGIIFKYLRSVTFLIFASGKIVISGAKSEDELLQVANEIQQKIQCVR